MKERHRESARLNAREVLKACRIHLGADFHTLSSAQVEALLAAADQMRYQRPRGANGSRARYFHDWMQRLAHMEVRS